jgi:16S rRNA (guanine966-N2)-methyltransferase
MRIISGKNKGRQIIAPANLPARPTTNFAKEALFNILSNHFEFQRLEVLDLFAGIGNISFEFVSRDVNSVVAVDTNNNCTNFIRQMSEKLGYHNLFVIRADFRSFIAQTEKKWDLVFADPPYDMDDTGDLPQLVFGKGILKAGGWFILEHDKHFNFSEFPYWFDHRVYGKVNFSFFRQQE